MKDESALLAVLVTAVVGMVLVRLYSFLNVAEAGLLNITAASLLLLALLFAWDRYSLPGRERRRCVEHGRELPATLLRPTPDVVHLGFDQELRANVFLPDSIRSRHVHVVGATGSGKTESVILNFLKQDVARGLGAIILDAKGDRPFLDALEAWVPETRLRIFDLGSAESLTYDPLAAGSPLEAAQRLFSSLTWSEEYYRSKAFSALQRLFQNHSETHGRNPKLSELTYYLEGPEQFIAATHSETYPTKLAEKDYSELSGLRDQLRTLCTGYLAQILSPDRAPDMDLTEAASGRVFYFRLQSLLSPQLVTTLGKLLINHLSFLAGTAHRTKGPLQRCKLIPVYLDEFASFACPEFADLISKARSAGFALHFSHQSVGDLMEVSPGFLGKITDNSATKIVLRVADPDTAEFFARSFGTKLYQKITQRITNVKRPEDDADALGEGTQRVAHQFRAPPDLFKTLPTGVGSVLIAHGIATPHGGSSVFKVKFPLLGTSCQRPRTVQD